MVGEETGAPTVGVDVSVPGVQQSMGHLPSLSPTDTPEVDAGGSASLW